MLIQIDTREKPKATKLIVATFDRMGVQHFSSKLPVGDYTNFDRPKLVIDRKQNLLELCGNVCQQHDRFCRELELARTLGVKLIILVEHGPKIKCLDDVRFWVNPRLVESPLAVSGERLYRILVQLRRHYQIEYDFCTKAQTGKRIVSLLGGDEYVLRS